MNKPNITTIEEEYEDTLMRIQYLIDYMNDNGLLEDNSFTFPDGQTWLATK